MDQHDIYTHQEELQLMILADNELLVHDTDELIVRQSQNHHQLHPQIEAVIHTAHQELTERLETRKEQMETEDNVRRAFLPGGAAGRAGGAEGGKDSWQLVRDTFGKKGQRLPTMAAMEMEKGSGSDDDSDDDSESGETSPRAIRRATATRVHSEKRIHKMSKEVDAQLTHQLHKLSTTGGGGKEPTGSFQVLQTNLNKQRRRLPTKTKEMILNVGDHVDFMASTTFDKALDGGYIYDQNGIDDDDGGAGMLLLAAAGGGNKNGNADRDGDIPVNAKGGDDARSSFAQFRASFKGGNKDSASKQKRDRAASAPVTLPSPGAATDTGGHGAELSPGPVEMPALDLTQTGGNTSGDINRALNFSRTDAAAAAAAKKRGSSAAARKPAVDDDDDDTSDDDDGTNGEAAAKPPSTKTSGSAKGVPAAAPAAVSTDMTGDDDDDDSDSDGEEGGGGNGSDTSKGATTMANQTAATPLPVGDGRGGPGGENEPVVVQIQCFRGKDLKNKAVMEKMDPYLKIVLGHLQAQTQVQNNGHRTPFWQGEICSLTVPKKHSPNGTSNVPTHLIIECWDHEKKGEKYHRFIGRTTIPVPAPAPDGTIPALGMPEKSWYLLDEDKKGKKTKKGYGSLELSIGVFQGSAMSVFEDGGGSNNDGEPAPSRSRSGNIEDDVGTDDDDDDDIGNATATKNTNEKDDDDDDDDDSGSDPELAVPARVRSGNLGEEEKDDSEDDDGDSDSDAAGPNPNASVATTVMASSARKNKSRTVVDPDSDDDDSGSDPELDPRPESTTKKRPSLTRGRSPSPSLNATPVPLTRGRSPSPKGGGGGDGIVRMMPLSTDADGGSGDDEPDEDTPTATKLRVSILQVRGVKGRHAENGEIRVKCEVNGTKQYSGFKPCASSKSKQGVVKFENAIDFALSPEQRKEADTKIVLVVEDGHKPAAVFGNLSLPTNLIRQGVPTCLWYTLRDKKGNEDRSLGKINIGIQWEDDAASFERHRAKQYDGSDDDDDDDDNDGNGGDSAGDDSGDDGDVRDDSIAGIGGHDISAIAGSGMKKGAASSGAPLAPRGGKRTKKQSLLHGSDSELDDPLDDDDGPRNSDSDDESDDDHDIYGRPSPRQLAKAKQKEKAQKKAKAKETLPTRVRVCVYSLRKTGTGDKVAIQAKCGSHSKKTSFHATSESYKWDAEPLDLKFTEKDRKKGTLEVSVVKEPSAKRFGVRSASGVVGKYTVSLRDIAAGTPGESKAYTLAMTDTKAPESARLKMEIRLVGDEEAAATLAEADGAAAGGVDGAGSDGEGSGSDDDDGTTKSKTGSSKKGKKGAVGKPPPSPRTFFSRDTTGGNEATTVHITRVSTNDLKLPTGAKPILKLQCFGLDKQMTGAVHTPANKENATAGWFWGAALKGGKGASSPRSAEGVRFVGVRDASDGPTLTVEMRVELPGKGKGVFQKKGPATLLGEAPLLLDDEEDVGPVTRQLTLRDEHGEETDIEMTIDLTVDFRPSGENPTSQKKKQRGKGKGGRANNTSRTEEEAKLAGSGSDVDELSDSDASPSSRKRLTSKRGGKTASPKAAKKGKQPQDQLEVRVLKVSNFEAPKDTDKLAFQFKAPGSAMQATSFRPPPLDAAAWKKDPVVGLSFMEEATSTDGGQLEVKLVKEGVRRFGIKQSPASLGSCLIPLDKLEYDEPLKKLYRLGDTGAKVQLEITKTKAREGGGVDANDSDDAGSEDDSTTAEAKEDSDYSDADGDDSSDKVAVSVTSVSTTDLTARPPAKPSLEFKCGSAAKSMTVGVFDKKGGSWTWGGTTGKGGGGLAFEDVAVKDDGDVAVRIRLELPVEKVRLQTATSHKTVLQMQRQFLQLQIPPT
jgi:hypothetical protein